MKRYIVCAGDVYYPNGGMADYVMDTSSLSKAMKAAVEASMVSEGSGKWSNIFDSWELKIVADYRNGEVDPYAKRELE